jgi:catechol 2,3-dioxygenase-like lactoylglutathione lyase family enzyme
VNTRRSLLAQFLSVLLWLHWLPVVNAGPPIVDSLDSVGITVSDLERSTAFYTGVLGFRSAWEQEVSGPNYEHLFGLFGLRLRLRRLTLGAESIELMQFLTPWGRPIPVDSRSNDHWFQHVALITGDMDRAYQHLREHGVAHASSGPQRLPDWNTAAGGIRAFYFRDPDGNHLEILQFPPGKGDPRWQRHSDALLLGIDHTAIVVADTDSSLAFYRDLLGMSVAGSSENYGTEQEHLNNVFGARLRITALRAASGPGVELLEYLAPAGGRPMPVDTRASDLWYWQINLRSPDLDIAWQRLREGHAGFVSPGPVSVAESQLGFVQGLLVRDPDGHHALLQQR